MRGLIERTTLPECMIKLPKEIYKTNMVKTVFYEMEYCILHLQRSLNVGWGICSAYKKGLTISFEMLHRKAENEEQHSRKEELTNLTVPVNSSPDFNG